MLVRTSMKSWVLLDLKNDLKNPKREPFNGLKAKKH